MIDEAHERTLATDILIGLLKDILPQRPNFKIVYIIKGNNECKKFSEFLIIVPFSMFLGEDIPDIHYTLLAGGKRFHAQRASVDQRAGRAGIVVNVGKMF
ncbi:BAF_HP2_G0030070.mRNA.1.CDS.1 [Saccharomyces cerevisiae]|nr:BAF_HP2_G0030070.mRNA.1.CDS.1 [Saccharomyces cerevisiae]CAI6454653.1 BAF_HP2_G0030070.mRNA.1.CDS.1 [Saccharomyces cerevisiae]